MRAVSSFAIPAILGVLSRRISGQLRRSGVLAGLGCSLAAWVLGTCGIASAQTATATTLAVT